MEANPTTVVREVKTASGDSSCYGPDEYLERNISIVKGALGDVHRSTLVRMGRTLNVLTGSISALEENLGRPGYSRDREHRTRLNHNSVVAHARAAIRLQVVPLIKEELLEQRRVSSMTIPQIQTLAHPLNMKGGKQPTINPQFCESVKVAEERVRVSAKFILRVELGGLE